MKPAKDAVIFLCFNRCFHESWIKWWAEFQSGRSHRTPDLKCIIAPNIVHRLVTGSFSHIFFSSDNWYECSKNTWANDISRWFYETFIFSHKRVKRQDHRATTTASRSNSIITLHIIEHSDACCYLIPKSSAGQPAGETKWILCQVSCSSLSGSRAERSRVTVRLMRRNMWVRANNKSSSPVHLIFRGANARS